MPGTIVTVYEKIPQVREDTLENNKQEVGRKGHQINYFQNFSQQSANGQLLEVRLGIV